MGICSEARKVEAANRKAPRISAAFDGRGLVIQNDRTVSAGASNRKGVLEVGIGCREVSIDLLCLPSRREIERAADRARRKRQPTKKAPWYRFEISDGTRAAGIEHVDGDHSRSVVRQEDPPIADERPQSRPTTGPIRISVIRRIKRQFHGAQAKRIAWPVKTQVEPWPLDMPIEHHLHWSELRLTSGGCDVERSVSKPLSPAAKPELGRIKLQVGQMDGPVIPALQTGGHRRKAACKALEEAVVEAADPRLGAASHVAAVAILTWYDTQVGHHIHDTEPGNEVALHRTRQLNVEATGHEIDQEGQLAVPLRAGELEVLPLNQLGCDA